MDALVANVFRALPMARLLCYSMRGPSGRASLSLTRAPLSLKIVLYDPMRSDDVAPEALANAGCAVIEILPGGQKSWAEEIL